MRTLVPFLILPPLLLPYPGSLCFSNPVSTGPVTTDEASLAASLVSSGGERGLTSHPEQLRLLLLPSKSPQVHAALCESVWQAAQSNPTILCWNLWELILIYVFSYLITFCTSMLRGRNIFSFPLKIILMERQKSVRKKVHVLLQIKISYSSKRKSSRTYSIREREPAASQHRC